MKKYLLFTILSIFTINARSQLYFPPVEGNEWDTISPVILGWDTLEIDTLLNYLEENNTKAFIVLQDGKIVIEEYFDEFAKDSLWYWASAGKTMTAFMTGIAQQEGYLSINDTTSKYLGTGWTNCSASDEEKITIWNQLTMTSGLNDTLYNPYCTLDTCLDCIAEPGTRWAYHNAPYTLLIDVINNSVGKNINAYINEKLTPRTGIKGWFFPVGYNKLFLSTARVMARFGLLVLNNGNWDGDQIMTDTAYFNEMTNTSQNLNESYGYLWWLNGKDSIMVPGIQWVFPGPMTPNAPDDMIAALGKNSQLINVAYSLNLIFIRMGNAPTGISLYNFNDAIWERLNKVLGVYPYIAKANAFDAKLIIYPNPAENYACIKVPKKHFDLMVFNVMGNIVKKINNCYDQYELDTKTLTKGIYFIKAKTDLNKNLNGKMIVIR